MIIRMGDDIAWIRTEHYTLDINQNNIYWKKREEKENIRVLMVNIK